MIKKLPLTPRVTLHRFQLTIFMVGPINRSIAVTIILDLLMF